ncbi:MAG TPA: type VI secretion system lipoprotein TssJ [Rhodopila sp.]|uniref:type VI secretion system lipoprotein TssJ n=1 Tax=Rhodopila sp. TaxID=2480087 RepID=UPI002C59274C|nr:type VI secretion system lipoprotein TssJ [Rhodopila sp.]HVY16447.1 type VI secretion system lipoprotein TssJ [Rhodopila sp.]
MLAGCSSAPPPPPPTVVYVKLVATKDVNGGAPISVRVYQLGSKSSFEQAEFFPLYKTDATALGPDLIKKDEVLLAPGTTKVLTLSPTDPVKAIGVFAAYARFQTATWRADADVPAHETTTVTATIGASEVKVASAPGKPPGS